MVKSQSQKLKLDEGYFSRVIATAVTNGRWLLYRRDYELFFGQKTDSMDLLTCMTSVSHLVSQTKRLLHNEEGEIPRNGCRIFSSVRAVISATCVEQLPFICLIYPIFSQTVQSLSLILWLRVFYLIVNEMSLTGSDNDGFLDILNDSLEESDIGSASDSDCVEKSDHDSFSEFSGTLSSDSETEEVIHERSDSWIGRDRVCSGNKQEPSKNVRTRAHNIYPGRQGPRSAARHAKTPFEIWSLFMTKDIIDVIVLNTNVYIGKIRANTDGTGVEIFSSTMSLQRLRFLLRCLRFDDHATRSERKRQDKLAAIRIVFDTFVRNCTENYMHSAHVTIDEVLVSFKGRCPFRMYISSKAAKYGIKIFELSDSETYYVSKMEVYVGKQNEGPHQMDTSPALLLGRRPTEGEANCCGDHEEKQKADSQQPIWISEKYDSEKPEIVVFYNKTKSGVEHADQLAQCYNTARKSRPWPLAIFFHLLNVSIDIHLPDPGPSTTQDTGIEIVLQKP
ncbi:PiggyBac transposable element-derived protein 4 [Trichinella sp. T6]|nr:PiggyBac transposable element-derived protein 4 [Trichinella sp. T6]